MFVGSAVVLNVVEHLVRDLEDGLVDNVLVGPGLLAVYRLFTMQLGSTRNALDAKLDALEALGQLVDHLLLDGAMGPRAAHRGGGRSAAGARAERCTLKDQKTRQRRLCYRMFAWLCADVLELRSRCFGEVALSMVKWDVGRFFSSVTISNLATVRGARLPCRPYKYRALVGCSSPTILQANGRIKQRVIGVAYTVC